MSRARDTDILRDKIFAAFCPHCGLILEAFCATQISEDIFDEKIVEDIRFHQENCIGESLPEVAN